MKILKDHSFLKKNFIVDWEVTDLDEASSYHYFEDWLSHNYQGPLTYLTGDRAKMRKNLTSFFPSFQSAIVFLFSYAPTVLALKEHYTSKESNGLKIASYAFGFEGEDYHYWIKKILSVIIEELKIEDPLLEVQLAMDVHPVLDRDLALRANLGWIGKNSMLISKKEGSYFLIASLLLSKKIEKNQTRQSYDHCGNCHLCFETCPTNAILPDMRMIDASLCISTYTIEVFDELKMSPPIGMGRDSQEIFGCDICQDICPWNKKLLSKLSSVGEWKSYQEEMINFWLKRPLEEIFKVLSHMTGREFRRKFKGTSFERSGKKGMLKNLKFYLKGNHLK